MQCDASHNTGMAQKSSIADLPDEILQLILHQVPSEDTLLHIQRLSRRFARICNEPLLWRYHCVRTFRYWDPKHRIQQKLLASVGNVDWKKLYLYRRHVESQTNAALDGILAGQIRRIEKYDRISSFGYDAKDALLRHCRTGDDAEDVLARRSAKPTPYSDSLDCILTVCRFHSSAILDHIHRAKALEEWKSLSLGHNISLERALGAFDMFIIHDTYGDLVEVDFPGSTWLLL